MYEPQGRGQVPLYKYNEARHGVPGSSVAYKYEFKCKSRGMETCLHSRGAALNARETGIYFNRQMLAKNKAKISKFIAVLPKSGFIAAPEDCLRRPQVFICRMR